MASAHPHLRIKSFDYSELIDGFLYLGSGQTSKNLDGLRSLNITHIVNLAGRCHYPSEFTYGTFHIEDGPSTTKCDKYLPLILQFIDQAHAEQQTNSKRSIRVLIHCRGGLSRTPFIAITYLMYKMHMSLIDAFDLVKQCRPQIHIHKEHLQTLLRFEREQSDAKTNSCTIETLLAR